MANKTLMITFVLAGLSCLALPDETCRTGEDESAASLHLLQTKMSVAPSWSKTPSPAWPVQAQPWSARRRKATLSPSPPWSAQARPLSVRRRKATPTFSLPTTPKSGHYQQHHQQHYCEYHRGPSISQGINYHPSLIDNAGDMPQQCPCLNSRCEQTGQCITQAKDLSSSLPQTVRDACTTTEQDPVNVNPDTRDSCFDGIKDYIADGNCPGNVQPGEILDCWVNIFNEATSGDYTVDLLRQSPPATTSTSSDKDGFSLGETMKRVQKEVDKAAALDEALSTKRCR